MARMGFRRLLCMGLLLIFFVLASGFAEPPPGAPYDDPPETQDTVAAVRDITMAEFIAMEQDRLFDYSFSFRYVKSGDIAYYVRFSSLYLCEGRKGKLLLDNALVYWMYIDGRGDLWFCVRGGFAISSGELVERKALYRYNRADESFVKFKEENARCEFSNRVYKSFILYCERGYLKAYDTLEGGTYLLGRTDDPSVTISPDGEAIYFTDGQDRKIRLTGLGQKSRHKTVLKPENFPLGVYTFEETVVDTRREMLCCYRFNGTGYNKVCEFAPPSNFSFDSGTLFAPMPGGIGAVEDPNRARVSYYNFNTALWSRFGGAEYADACGFGSGVFWFYTREAPVRLYILRGMTEYSYTFGDWIDGCSGIRTANGRVYVFRYDEDWLTHVFETATRTLYRISD